MKKDKSGPFEQAQSQIEAQLGGLLGHLGTALSEVVKKLDEAAEVQHSTTIDTENGPLRASAGIKIRTLGGSGGAASTATKTRRFDQPINSAKGAATKPKPAPEHVEWPITVTVLSDDANWSLVAELPGVILEDVELQIENGMLEIRAQGRGKFYRGSFDVPASLSIEQMSSDLVNGILELKAAEASS